MAVKLATAKDAAGVEKKNPVYNRIACLHYVTTVIIVAMQERDIDSDLLMVVSPLHGEI